MRVQWERAFDRHNPQRCRTRPHPHGNPGSGLPLCGLPQGQLLDRQGALPIVYRIIQLANPTRLTLPFRHVPILNQQHRVDAAMAPPFLPPDQPGDAQLVQHYVMASDSKPTRVKAVHAGPLLGLLLGTPSSLGENGPHRLTESPTWCPAQGTHREGLGAGDLLEKVCH